MSRTDPFYGYSLLLRLIVFAGVPAFCGVQFFRLRRALHVFQLEGYKRARFLAWCRAHRDRALFLRPMGSKKPLVMTGRAWRILVASLLLTLVVVLVLPGLVHIWGGWPYDVITWAVATAGAFLLVPVLLVAGDAVLVPVQRSINKGYERAAREKLARIDPVVIAVTGSFGKTSTKHAIAGLVGPPGSALATPGSFNTPLGICRAVNERLEDGHRYFVVEMGAYKEGEIAELCALVGPKVGVLTAIGPAHLERFGSLDAIRRAKYEIVRDLPADGLAVMNADDPEVHALAKATSHVAVSRYGIASEGDPAVSAREIQFDPEGTAFVLLARGEERRVRMRLLGRHAVGHVLAGVAVALHAGRSLDDIVAAIGSLSPVEHRLELIGGTGGVTVIDDAYNSNPEGALAALEVLRQMPARRRVVVTPGIIELGELQYEANATFGEQAARVADTLIAVAKTNREALLAGARRGGGAEIVAVDSLAEAQRKLEEVLAPGDVVLFENDLPDQYEG